MYYNYNREDKKDMDDMYYSENYEQEDEENDEEEEDSSQDAGQMPGKGNMFKGAKNFLGKAGKTIKKVVEVIAKLPMPVKVALLVALTGIIFAIIAEATKEEATAGVTNSTNNTVSSMNSEASDLKKKKEEGTITSEEEKKLEKLEKAIEQFNGKNSYLYFTISNINDAYDDFVSEYKGSTNDVQSRNYKSLSTEFGDVELAEELKNERIVDSNQKLPLYIHLLMTEKYNFNAVKWKWYGHGRDGEEITEANMTLDKELGLKYPNDGTTKIETFVDLLSPYMLTWHIPLGFHSGFLTKSGSDKQASNFTYSIVKNAYSDIVAHRYDIQKHILNTKFDTYYEYKYKSQFKSNISVTYKYVAKTKGKNTYEVDNSARNTATAIEVFDITVGNGILKNQKVAIGIENSSEECVALKTNGYTIKSNLEEAIVDIYNIYKKNTGKTNLILSRNGGINESYYSGLIGSNNKLEVMEFRTLRVQNEKYEAIRAYIYTINVNVITSEEYMTDNNGNVLYDMYIKYEYGEPEVLEPLEVSKSDLINTRIDAATGKEDPMKEDYLDESTTVTNKYYISKAKTFDVIIANEFNYIKYKESDVANRTNPKSQSQYALQDYFEEEKIENKLDTQKIKSTYLNGTLANIDNNSSITCTSNKIDSEYYNAIKDKAAGEEVLYREVSMGNFPTMAHSTSSSNILSYTQIYQNTYRNENEYIIKEGKSDEGNGTHYIRRIWEDTLTQKSSKTTTYTEEDLVTFNAEYNANLNGTSVADEEKKYQEIANKSESSYSMYKSLAATKMLTTIDFVNSNSNIYSEYLIENSPQSKIMGYNREYLKFALEEVKRLFKETEDKNGTIPYVYGVSLGFTKILSESGTRTINSRSQLFLWPMSTDDCEEVSYIFGYSKVYSGGTYSNPGSFGLHSGIDLSKGDAEVLAAADGKVITCVNTFANGQYQDNSYGNYVIIDHGNGYATLYAHMAQDVRVNQGDEVKKGQVIGISNTTGSSTGMHLHYEIRQDINNDGKFDGDENIDPLEFYVVEPANGNTIEYDELLLHPELGEQITMQGAYKFVGYVYNSSGMDLTQSSLSKENFVASCQANINISPGMEFYEKLEYTYEYCQNVGVNPEWAIMTAIAENGKLDGYGVHNYWNTNVGNGQDPQVAGAHSSYEEALEEFCNLILSYRDENSSAYRMIMARAEERENAACNPEGYGGPDTLAGIQSVYSWLGSDHSGNDWGTGGMAYINVPGIIYETQEEIEEKCWSKHGTEGGRTSTQPTTIEEQNNYTAWQVRTKLETRDKIFGST